MNRTLRALIISSSLLIAASILLAVLLITDPERTPAAATEPSVILSLPVSRIAAVAVQHAETSFGLLIGENGLIEVVSEEEGIEYSQKELQAFIYQVSKLNALSTLDGDQGLSTYGLDQQKVQITVITDEKEVLRFFLGDRTPYREAFYLRAEATDSIYAVDAAVAALFTRTEEGFWDRSLLPIENVSGIERIEQVSIRAKDRPDRLYTLRYDTDLNYLLSDPFSSTTDTETVLKELILPIISLYAHQLVAIQSDDELFGFDDPDYSLEVTIDGILHTLQFSRQENSTIVVRSSRKTGVFSIDPQMITFLQTDYLDLLDQRVFHTYREDLQSVTFTDYRSGRDHHMGFSITEHALQAVLDGKPLDEAASEALFEAITGIGIVRELKDLPVLQESPRASLQFTFEDGRETTLTFFQIGDSQSAVAVDGQIHLSTYSSTIDELETLMDSL
ncbi:MAG: DUF4340 domain-containing protein [Spirochaetia bacterium]|nr:DUF4340 domain-containing protein [Spirochaetia bacterium]